MVLGQMGCYLWEGCRGRKGSGAFLLIDRALSLGRLREDERAEEEGRMGEGRGYRCG